MRRSCDGAGEGLSSTQAGITTTLTHELYQRLRSKARRTLWTLFWPHKAPDAPKRDLWVRDDPCPQILWQRGNPLETRVLEALSTTFLVGVAGAPSNAGEFSDLVYAPCKVDGEDALDCPGRSGAAAAWHDAVVDGPPGAHDYRGE